MILIDLIKSLFRRRSPTLESCGYYCCENCTHCAICLPLDDPVLYRCTLKIKLVDPYDTCKWSNPIVIKPLSKSKRGGRGLRAMSGIIDECSDFDSTITYKQALAAVNKSDKGETK